MAERRRRVIGYLRVSTAEQVQRGSGPASSGDNDWRRRYPDFPQPVAQLKQALIWNWPEVERWARKTGRFPPSHGRRDGVDSPE